MHLAKPTIVLSVARIVLARAHDATKPVSQTITDSPVVAIVTRIVQIEAIWGIG